MEFSSINKRIRRIGQRYAELMDEEQIDQTDVFILFDMIADDDFHLPYERNSDMTYVDDIWNTGIDLGYGDIFSLEPGPSLIDDHIPFKNLGIPTVDIIDFDYPEWHTTEDNLGAIDPESVAIVIDTIYEWMLRYFDLTSDGITSIESSQSRLIMNHIFPYLIIIVSVSLIVKKD